MPEGIDLHMVADDSAVVTLPNAISLARLCAVPVAVWFVLHGDLRPAFVLFLAAGLSDALDGFLARRGRGSRVGRVLDPLADKALLVSMYVVLAVVRLLPDWLAMLVVFRDVVIVGGVMLIALLGEPVEIAPLRISKLNTALQIALVAGQLCATAFGLPFVGRGLLVLCVATTTLVSGIVYVVQAARR